MNKPSWITVFWGWDKGELTLLLSKANLLLLHPPSLPKNIDQTTVPSICCINISCLSIQHLLQRWWYLSTNSNLRAFPKKVFLWCHISFSNRLTLLFPYSNASRVASSLPPLSPVYMLFIPPDPTRLLLSPCPSALGKSTDDVHIAKSWGSTYRVHLKPPKWWEIC